MKNRTLPYLSGRFFDGISSGLFMMSLPWMMLKLGDMGTFVALLALVCTLLSFILTPLFSTLIDRHSRKLILVLVQFVQTATAGFVLLSYLFEFNSHWILAIAQLLFWVSSNLGWTTNNAFTQENYEPNEYASISGKQEIIMQVTTLGAGGFGVMLLEYWSMREFSGFAMASSLVATVSYMITPYRRQLRDKQQTSFSKELIESVDIVKQQPHFYALLMLSALSYPIITYLGKLVPIWFSEVGISGEWLAGYNVAFGLGSLITGFVIGKILQMNLLPNIILFAMVASSVAVLGMSIILEPIYLMIFTLLFGLFNAINRIARTNWMHHTINIAHRGRADGALQMFATLIQSLSYVVIAMLSHYQLTQYGFLIAAAVMLASSLFARILINKLLKTEQDLVNAGKVALV